MATPEEKLKNLRDQIFQLTQEYNKLMPPGEDRVIATTHEFFCRCTTCWYDYKTSELDEKYGSPSPYEKCPTDEMIKKINAERQQKGFKPKNYPQYHPPYA